MELKSTVKRWPGHVVLPEYLTYPQLQAWDDAVSGTDGFKANPIKFYAALLPVSLAAVKEWHIEGLPEKVTLEVWPASSKLTAWLVDAVMALFDSTNEAVDPKDSAPPSTPESVGAA